MGLNPGPYTLQGTNTYLIGNGQDRILVDTGEAETATAYISQLFDFVFPATGAKGLSDIVLTHGHHDHQGGVHRILEECQHRGMRIPKVHKYCPQQDSFPLGKGIECLSINDEQIFTTEGATLRAVHTPGHCSDHVSFVLQEDNAVLSGDCVLGCGSTVFEDLKTYMHSLNRLLNVMVSGVAVGNSENHDPLAIPIKTIYPGHGPVIFETGIEKVKEYLSHRKDREEQILSALQSHKKYDGWIPSWSVMREVYKGSLDEMSLIIKISAQASTIHHLTKLERENLVEKKWPDLWRRVSS